MITVLWPVPRQNFYISSTWEQHLARPGYKREYAGTDLAAPEQPLRVSQYNGKVLQAMYSSLGYGYTTFVEYGGILRVRNAHQKNLNVSVGQIVNPGDVLGTLDTTGNSTGNHTHMEIWLLFTEGWKNIDPLNPIFGINFVNEIGLLVPIDGQEPGDIPMSDYIPEIPDLPTCKTSAYITLHVNLRSFPSTTGKILGRINPGEVWEVSAHHLDTLGNIWYALRKGQAIGWGAAVWNGVVYMELIQG